MLWEISLMIINLSYIDGNGSNNFRLIWLKRSLEINFGNLTLNPFFGYILTKIPSLFYCKNKYFF